MCRLSASVVCTEAAQLFFMQVEVDVYTETVPYGVYYKRTDDAYVLFFAAADGKYLNMHCLINLILYWCS